MKAASVTEIKRELKTKSSSELIELCLKLSKFKKENKELLTYWLYEADDENAYISAIKEEIEIQFTDITNPSLYYITKSVRKILRITKKYIRYSKIKETEIELLIHFCSELKSNTPIKRSTVLQNIYQRQIETIYKKIKLLHEDLQYDYNVIVKEVLEN